jgi:predicted alpha/beta superfamily hydrolase
VPPGLIENPFSRQIDVLYVYDGQQVSILNIILDPMIITGLIKELVVIGIPSTGNRTYELSPTPCNFDACANNCPPYTSGLDPKCNCGTGEFSPARTGGLPKNIDFLLNTVKPVVEKQYGYTSTPKQSGILGSSFGGLAACYTPFLTSQITRAACLSPSLYWNCEEFNNTVLPSAFPNDIMLYLDAGTAESRILYPTRNAWSTILNTDGYNEGGNTFFKIWENHYHDTTAIIRRLYYSLMMLFGADSKNIICNGPAIPK